MTGAVRLLAVEGNGMDWDHSRPWYHGSPAKLTSIRKGSTVTQDIDLARVFSHKPTLVSISEDGSGNTMHDGTRPGFLYRISEDISPSDVYPHPRSSMEPGKEWLTKRDLQVKLLGSTTIAENERLSEAKIASIRRFLAAREP